MEFQKYLGDFLKNFPSNDKVKVIINDTYWVLNCRRCDFNNDAHWRYYKVLYDNYLKEPIRNILIEFDNKGSKIWKVYVENDKLDMDMLYCENIWYDSNCLYVGYLRKSKKKGVSK